MRLRRRTANIVLTLCLLVLQAQVLAAGLLGCRHDPGVADDALQSGCHFHGAQTDGGNPQPPADAGRPLGDAGQGLLDCTKCALHCAIGVFAPVAAPTPQAAPRPPQPSALPGRHFYRFSPEADIRPPIERLLPSHA